MEEQSKRIAARANLPRTHEALEVLYKQPLPSIITTKGDKIIKPNVRKHLKDTFMHALSLDLMEALPEYLEVVQGCDGYVLVVQHEVEGCLSIEMGMKVKGLDYDAWELGEKVTED